MARQVISLGTGPNTKTGDSARVGGDKINQMFEELYMRLDILSRIDIITENKGFSLVSDDLTVNADWEWVINNEIYTNPDPVVFSDIPLSASGNSRLVYVVPNAANSFDMLDGEETTGTPEAPELPNGGMYVTYFEVTDTAIGDLNEGYDGDSLANKTDKGGYLGTSQDLKDEAIAADAATLASANAYTDTIAADKVDKDGSKVLSDNNYSTSEKNKLASIDATHYLPPLQTTVQLSALPQATISDKARVYVENELSDYFYDATASSGDIAPDDQTGGVGFWKQVAVGGETAVSIKTKYESNPDTNAYTDAEQALVATISGKEDTSNKTGTVVGNEASTSLYLHIAGMIAYFQQKLTDSIFGAFINGLTAKTTPVDADYDVIMDSADLNKAKKVSFANRKATLKAYFDTLYMDLGSIQDVTGLKTFLNTKFALRNIANTFSITFLNSVTANRTVTFQDKSYTVADNADLALKINKAGDTFTGPVVFPASTTSIAPINLPEGVTKTTSPATGDIQNLSDRVQIRKSSAWYSFMFSNAANPDLSAGSSKALTVDSVGMPVTVDLQGIVVNTVALVAGVATITISGVTTSSICMATQIITPAGTLGNGYKAVCTASTLTITAIDSTGATVTTDTSTLSYTVLL